MAACAGRTSTPSSTDPAAPSPAHRAPTSATTPALTTSADPRLAGRGTSAAGILALQRSAGNAAVTSLVGGAAPVQRTVTIDDFEGLPTPPAQDGGAGAGSDAVVTSDGGTTTIRGAHVTIDAPMTETAGVFRADTIIADNVVGSNYTPGAGNTW